MLSSQHNYATRIRHNVQIKPAPRRRHSPDPLQRRPQPQKQHPPQPQPNSPPQVSFLPPHIVLHPDDANSRVFQAIARSFLSVDNRAMTIKDLADMTVKFGLVCQNVSAASQAITTYIRTHMQRCEVQQDSPLLLKHVLSGTSSDDDLLPALHSRSGGAHCTSQAESRATNFRRGTMVWYLSRATGAPCPFARAGIRLCDYTDNGRRAPAYDLPKDKKRGHDRQTRASDDQHCGQKRKRLLRGCAAADDSDSDAQPPPKVKLTLRLKPLPPKVSTSPDSHREVIDITHSSSESDDYMSDDDDSEDDDEAQDPRPEPQPAEEEPWSLPPYPRRSISIPCYTPRVGTTFSYPFYPELPPINRCRSPSSVPSLPPDSEDEDDFHITMTRTSQEDSNDWDQEADSDGYGDAETHWESPGPRSPSAPILPKTAVTDITVKQEPRDVQSLLDTWEDTDSFACSYPASSDKVKLEPMSTWGWDNGSSEWFSPLFDDIDATHSPSVPPLSVKQEEIDFESLLAPSSSSSPDSSYSIEAPESTQRRYSEVHIDRSPDDVIHNDNDLGTIRRRSKTVPAPAFHQSSSSTLHLEMPSSSQSPVMVPSEVLQSPTLTSLASLIQSMSMSSPTAVSPVALLRVPGSSSTSTLTESVVVHTCQPCIPVVSATHVEATPVYQMTLGNARLLRRVDTDFVNLSPVASYLGTPLPSVASVINAVAVTKGSEAVCGMWVPLGAAQAFIQTHLALASLPDEQRSVLQGLLDVFLSDILFERFPPALQAFHLHRGSTSERMLNHFGPHFTSTIQATQPSVVELQPPPLQPTQLVAKSQDVPDMYSPLSSFMPCIIPPLVMGTSSGVASIGEAPLSPSEQEMFQALCSIPEWEQDNIPPTIASVSSEPVTDAPELPEAESTPAAPPAVAQPPSDMPAVIPPVLHAESPTAQAPAADEEVSVVPAAEAEVDTSPDAVVERPQTRGRSGTGPLRRSKRVADAIASRTRSRRRGSTKTLS